MYTAFNLKLSLNNFKGIDEYIQLGKQQKVEKSEVAKKELDSFILSDTVLDGENLSDSWFKTSAYPQLDFNKHYFHQNIGK